MKNLFNKLLYPALALGLLAGCKKTGVNGDLKDPKVSITVSPSNPRVGDSVTVDINTDAEYLSIFTGDAGHMYERSRIKPIIEGNWEKFKDTVYKVSYAKDGKKATWDRYMKDYNTLDEFYQDFEMFGAISNVQLGVFNGRELFPESIDEMTYPDKNQLKFTITDRRIPSGFIFKPNTFVVGPHGDDPAWSVIETRSVCDPTDKAVRLATGNADSPSGWVITTRDLRTNFDTTIQFWNFNFMRQPVTNDPGGPIPSSGNYYLGDYFYADPYWKTFQDSLQLQLQLTRVKVIMNGRITQNEGAYSYDLDHDGVIEKYTVPLDTATGLPLNESDYSQYRGFQGDMYVGYINFGSNEYEQWNSGFSLGSIYSSTQLKKQYKYVYSGPGQYTITVIATNKGRKQYSGDGYQTLRIQDINDYPAKRALASSTITVSQ